MPQPRNRQTTIEINDQFRRALELMEGTDKNVFVTGRAGTGKSTSLEYFRNTTKKKVVVLAPTGVAALNVKGQTIHSFFIAMSRLSDPLGIDCTVILPPMSPRRWMAPLPTLFSIWLMASSRAFSFPSPLPLLLSEFLTSHCLLLILAQVTTLVCFDIDGLVIL